MGLSAPQDAPLLGMISSVHIRRVFESICGMQWHY